MVVFSREQAWAQANKLFPTDYDKDEASSVRAGYDIYRHNTLNPYNRICDLGNRLEVIVDEVYTNIWIEEPAEKVIDVRLTESDLNTLKILVAETGWGNATWVRSLEDKLEKAAEAIRLKYGEGK